MSSDRDRFETPRVGQGDPDALQALVRQRREGPSADSLRKIESGLAAAGVMQPSSAAGTEKRLFYPKLAGLFLIVAGGLLLGRHAWRESPKLPGATALASQANDAPNTATNANNANTGEAKGALTEATSATNGNATDITPAPTPKAEAIGTISVNELPTATPPAMAPSTLAPVNASAKNAAAPVSELALIQRAQSTLASDPPRALAITAEHARAFPSGEFVQEREVIAVEALSRLGRKDEARERASALLKRFPRTPYAARLEMATSTPLSKASERGALNPPNPNDPANAPATPAH